jgi:anaerobic selenocysteine-containing dehydrogenase
MAMGEPDEVLRALRSLELLVTVDPRMVETAREAHYVLAPCLMYERHDITGHVDASFWKPFAQYTPPVVPRPPGVVDEWEIFWGLGRRLGLQLELKDPVYGVLYSDLPEGVRIDMDTKPAAEDLIRILCDTGAVPFETLRAHPGGWTPPPGPESVVSAGSPDSTTRMDVCPPDVEAELVALVESAPLAPSQFRLATRRVRHTMNSAFSHTVTTQKHNAPNRVHMNPADLAAAGLLDGDTIRISGRHGSMVGVVKADPAVRRDVLSMSMLWGMPDPDSSAPQHTGRLVSNSNELQGITYMPLQTGIDVTIARVSE